MQRKVLCAFVLALIAAFYTANAVPLNSRPIHGGFAPPDLPGCDVFGDNRCQGNNIETPSEYANRQWQTPPPSDPYYLPSYQSMHQLVGHVKRVYSNDHKSCTVTIVTQQRDSRETLTFYFDHVAQSSPSKTYMSSQMTPVQVSVSGSLGSKLALDDVEFIWMHSTINHSAGDYRKGQKGAIVEFFGWPHKDVEAECEFLSKAGYMGAKLFPSHEQLMSWEPYDNELNPWYFMYQPVSYRQHGRMGTRDELRSLIRTCRSKNVRLFADAVVNHMVGCGNDANPFHRNPQAGCAKWGAKTSSSSNPAPFYSQCYAYTYNNQTSQPPSQEFPGVPYGPTDFHCERTLSSWTDPIALDAGWLVGLTDLNTDRPNVQQRIADYMTDLLSMGFSGFRVDAAKHIRPDSLAEIFNRVRINMGGRYPDDFHSSLEVIAGGEGNMLLCNTNSGYNFGAYFAQKLASLGLSSADVDKVKIWYSGYPKEPEIDCGSISNIRKVTQNDDHDQQNDGSSSRDMGEHGSVLVKEKNVDKHRSFEVQLFTNPRGTGNNRDDFPIRNVLSSYYFASNGAKAIPDGLSDCRLCQGSYCNSCKTVEFSKAYDERACGYTSVYTRVHRDLQIVNAMRSWVGLSPVTNEYLGKPSGCA
eukprot:TRINITY_DN13185_c0_g1_i1.p1 TRINITY_DN13185_c0_g1~~TRINITY_DN13185_c0_g1_i1.p1  ORF type:complete len:639 (-),score=113.59 TRINITY_DN13185_c0_g1_i1:113-2029(-)